MPLKVLAGFKSLSLFMDSPAVTADGLRFLKGLLLHTYLPGQTLTDAKLQALAEINLVHSLMEART